MSVPLMDISYDEQREILLKTCVSWEAERWKWLVMPHELAYLTAYVYIKVHSLLSSLTRRCTAWLAAS